MAIRRKNDARLDFRLNHQLKELIDRAASLLGQSVSDFAISTIVEKARRIVQESSTTVLSDRDRDIFLAMLDSDARPNKTLKRAAKRYKDSVSATLSHP
ncbi:MAG TPA: DUF1778 domain-containing protein [Gemmataceae bacterium]|jgi:uncharacterized protein (DUF1778 family)